MKNGFFVIVAIMLLSAGQADAQSFGPYSPSYSAYPAQMAPGYAPYYVIRPATNYPQGYQPVQTYGQPYQAQPGYYGPPYPQPMYYGRVYQSPPAYGGQGYAAQPTYYGPAYPAQPIQYGSQGSPVAGTVLGGAPQAPRESVAAAPAQTQLPERAPISPARTVEAAAPVLAPLPSGPPEPADEPHERTPARTNISAPDPAPLTESLLCQEPSALPPSSAPTCGIIEKMWLQLMSGAVFSPTRGIGPHDVPVFDLAPTDVRLGLVLRPPCENRWLFRGATVAILELSTDPVIKGFGNIVVGPAALIRYEFKQPGWPLVPYIQGGAGMSYNDAYQDRNQNAIGQAMEFTLHTAVGAHYFINPQWSLDAEADFLHISNAHLASRNAGVNALGGTIGFTCYFRK